MSGIPYEVSAETLYPSQVSFIRREDFISFIGRFPEAYQAVIRQLNSQYASACEQLRTVGLSTNAHEKIARLFLHWSSDERQTSQQARIKMPLTHEQIAECVGSTRETVTRTLSEFKSKHLVMLPRNNRNDTQPRGTNGGQRRLTQRMAYMRSIPFSVDRKHSRPSSIGPFLSSRGHDHDAIERHLSL